MKPVLAILILVVTGAAAAGQPPAPADGPPDPAGLATTESVAKDQLHDITGIERLRPEPEHTRWAVWIACALAVCVLGFLAGLGVVRRSKKPPEKSLFEWVLAELDQIQVSDDPSTDFHAKLTGVLRQYLLRRFDLATPGQTSEELLLSAQAKDVLSSEQQQALSDLLRRCDMAKFAGVRTSLDERQTLIAAVRALVEETSAGALDKDAAEG